MSSVRFTFTVIFVILLVYVTKYNKASSSQENESLVMEGMAAQMAPLIEEGKSVTMFVNESRRKLGGFRTCALCTCCGGPKGICLVSPCCYAINCNIPNRPFGYCAFTPKTCNCLGCHA